MSNSRTQKRKPSVSIIGAGRLGQALAIALRTSGYPIVAIVARRATHAQEAAAQIANAKKGAFAPLVLSAQEFKRVPESDLILISTPDDAIESVARALADSQAGTGRGRTILHTSGALSSEILSSLSHVGFNTGSMHPLISVSEPRAGAEALRGALYCLEGDKAAIRTARLLVSDLNGTAFYIKTESKALYHAAAVMASGHLVALFDLATEVLGNTGLSNKSTRRILLPLVQSTVNNLQVSEPEHALTGPFARGDLSTVDRHLKSLSGKKLAQALQVYKLLGLRSLQLAERNGLDRQLTMHLRKVLESSNVSNK